MINEASSGPSWIDVSVPLRTGMVRWPGDIPVEIKTRVSIEEGSEYNLTALSMGAHTGTHLDAPRHFLRDGLSVDRMPPELMVGPARVLAFPGVPVVTRAELAPYRITRNESILFKTDNSKRPWWNESFREDYVALSFEAASLLVQLGVALVGMDYLSVAPYQFQSAEIHRALLQAGVWLLEGVNLSGVGSGEYDMVCLPMKLVGSDGAPARVLLRPKR